jgi:hypothetical protein
MKMNRLYAVALAFCLAGIPAFAIGASTPLEELVSRMADTPEEHQAVADYFRGKAKAAREEAQTHVRMGTNYAGGKVRETMEMKKHCDAIAKAQTAIADEYEALAKLHEAEAKGAKPKP